MNSENMFAVPKTEGEQQMDADQEASLKLLNEAMADPTGDCVIKVESHDHALLRELWSLQGNGVEVTQTLQKALPPGPGEVFIVLKDVGAFLADTLLLLRVVGDALKIVQAQTQGDNKNAKTQIRTNKDVAKIRKLLAKYEKSVDAVLDIPADDADIEGDEQES